MKYLKYILIAILLLLVIFFGRGLLTSSVSYENTVMVDKSMEEAWAVMSDNENLPKWIKGFVKTELVSGTENTVGAVSNIHISENGQDFIMQETITKIDPPKYLAMDFNMDFMNAGMEYEMTLEPVDGKTKILTKSKSMGRGLFSKSIIAFMKGSMVKQEDANLASLKKLIDQNEKNYFPGEKVEAVLETN